MCVCMCTDAHRGQQKALDPRVGVIDSCEHPNESETNPTQVLWKSNKCYLPLSHLSSQEGLVIVSQRGRLRWERVEEL